MKQSAISIKSLVIVGLLFSACSYISCKKSWLDEKPNKNQAVPTTLNDFQAMMDFNSHMNAFGFALGEVAADGHYVTELSWSTANSGAARNAYTWSHNFPYSNLQSWEYTYKRVLYCNVVLEGLKKIVPNTLDDEQLYASVKGQALFNQAEAFWELAQLFAVQYDESSSQTDLGIPLRLTSDVTEGSTRATVRQTYEQIINSSKEAILLLPDSSILPTRGSKAAAYALLARVYLSMGNYDSALNYADKCLLIKNRLLDLNSISSSATSIGSTFANPLLNPEIIFFTRMYTSDLSNFATSQYLIESSLYNQYESNDLRRTRFFKSTPSTGAITFKGNYNNSTTIWFCGIATDEMYLTRAECYARKDNTSMAIGDLNFLLQKRFSSSYVPYFTNNSEDALSKILQERRKELVLRGLRWMDLRRLNKDNRFKVKLTRTIGGTDYTLEHNSYKYTFPIPDDVISITGMQQNIGW